MKKEKKEPHQMSLLLPIKNPNIESLEKLNDARNKLDESRRRLLLDLKRAGL